MRLTREKIKNVVPIESPMLCIDEICEIEYGKYVHGYRKIYADEYWCSSHFVDRPIFPGTLIIETMAQISAFMFYREGITKTLKSYLGRVDNVKFLQNVVPNCKIHIEAWIIMNTDKLAKMQCVARLENQSKIVAKGEITLFFLNAINETNEK